MTIGFSSRAAVRCSAVCVAGALALAPSAAAARAGTDPGTPRPSASKPPLYRAGTQVRPRAGAPEVPEDVSALSWLVADARTGGVLAAHDAHRKLPPASTLKTLFALTVLPVLPGGIRHTVTEEELQGIGDGSSLVGVAEGRTYQVADLWRGVFLNSGNDAVHVLAAMNGGWRTTAARMQAKARALGALDTHVRSPTDTTPRGRSRRPTTWRCSGGPGCATPNSHGTAPPSRPSSPAGAAGRTRSRTPTGC